MKIWIHLDGVQQGPFDLAELPVDRMTSETPVWYEGLSNWSTAGRAQATAHLFANNGTQSYQAAYAGATAQSSAAVAAKPDKCPATYLIWSILLTIIFFNPVGIVAIITGFIVSSRYRNYNYEGAQRMSETTAWWLMITIVTSLMSLPLSIIAAL